MKQKISTKVVVASQDINIDSFVNEHPTDYPLCVVVRESQIKIAEEAFSTDKYNQKPIIIGWWDLTKLGYLDSYGNLQNLNKWKAHKIIYFANPKRCWDPFREKYMEIINTLQDK